MVPTDASAGRGAPRKGTDSTKSTATNYGHLRIALARAPDVLARWEPDF